MAQRTQVVLTDDLDGSEATQTVTFAYDGAGYEIDLNDANASAMRADLAPYLRAGRRLGSKTGIAGGTTRIDSDGTAIRAWAKSKGMTVPARGRIPAHVREAFDADN